MDRNILIVYYSRSANTEKIAQLIQQKIGGTLCEIEPELAYPASYNAVVEQAKKEIQAGFRPELKTKIEHIESYDTVFVGSPNWWSTIAPPIATFLEGYDLSGKTVVPFCTHGGGGAGRVERDIVKLCPQSTMMPGLAIYGSGGGNAESQVSAWLQELGFVER
ncbi:MAG: flavodoxin [Firmicutes bacterium]|nr:flavodoxin [Bacillota bacterium]